MRRHVSTTVKSGFSKTVALDRGAKTVVAAAAAVGVNRSTWYRRKKQEATIKVAAHNTATIFYTSRTTKMYVRNPNPKKK
ncbi:hypothetical protein L917_10954 [Phytophthora nicotianae]|uniref:Uncharacterized protein n=1 Tax=Phytophthora nicotianae TaxID=4792 RepID=W2KYT1_PHYNI|nr:hypothetical protein L917_10954 [Phytophthora nicotianae]